MYRLIMDISGLGYVSKQPYGYEQKGYDYEQQGSKN